MHAVLDRYCRDFSQVTLFLNSVGEWIFNWQMTVQLLGPMKIRSHRISHDLYWMSIEYSPDLIQPSFNIPQILANPPSYIVYIGRDIVYRPWPFKGSFCVIM
jgi:hypothetical protein